MPRCNCQITRKGFAATALFLVFETALSARTPPVALNLTEGEDVRFTRLSTPEGLSQNRVEHIVQDDQGFMWFGTENGLNRYDGYSFRVFRHTSSPNSLSGVKISALFKDRSGMLWVAADQFLDRFDAATETFKHYRPDQNVGTIFSIFQDGTGKIWVAARHGLFSLDDATGLFSHHGLTNDDLWFVMQDRSGIFWLVSTAGLETLDPRTDRISRYPAFKQAEDSFWPDTRLYEDRSGLLWMISSSGTSFRAIDRNTHRITRYSFRKKEGPALIRNGIVTMHEDEDGTLWFATGGNGLVKFDRRHNTIVQYRNKPGVSGSLSNNFVFSLFEDREGTIWAGTGGGGVSHLQRKPLPIHVFQHDPASPNSLEQNYVLSAYEDSQGILWVGNDQVLNRLDRASGRYTFYRHEAADPGSISVGSVTSSVEDSDGFLWFGTYGGGLNRFDRRTGRFKSWQSEADPASLSNDRIYTLSLARNRILWIGTEDGLNSFDLRAGVFARFLQTVPAPVDKIVQDGQGLLWLGTIGGGLCSFDPRSRRFIAYRHRDSGRMSLSNDNVNALLMDESGFLWVGTQNGLDKFDLHTRTFTASYHSEDGMADDAVQGIEEDNRGDLWISTSKGLSRFQPRTARFTSFYGSDGLAGNDFSVKFPVSFRSRSGEIFFGGVDGITSFYPDQLNEIGNPYVPPVVLTELRINNVPVSPGGASPLRNAISYARQLTLSQKQRSFSLEFSALSYFNPLKNRYRYRLEGAENAWNETGSNRRFVTYTNLPPGDYVFRVQGSNNYGVWNESGIGINIHVDPPWWGTLWFRTASGVSLLVAVWVGYKYRLHQIYSQFALRIEERVGERTRIAQELHDTLLQSVLSASMQLHLAIDDLPEDSPLKPRFERVIQIMSKVIDEGRNTLRGLRTAPNDGVELEQAFSRIPEELNLQASPAFSILVSGKCRPLHPVIYEEAYRIGKEMLINAFRHSHAKTIEMELDYGASQMRIAVKDNGCGIAPQLVRSGRDGHWGLQGMQERAGKIGAALHVSTGEGIGTEIELVIDGRKAFQPQPDYSDSGRSKIAKFLRRPTVVKLSSLSR